MSQQCSQFRHPFDVVPRPSLEPEVTRAILARWASDLSAFKGKRAPRRSSGARSR